MTNKASAVIKKPFFLITLAISIFIYLLLFDFNMTSLKITGIVVTSIIIFVFCYIFGFDPHPINTPKYKTRTFWASLIIVLMIILIILPIHKDAIYKTTFDVFNILMVLVFLIMLMGREISLPSKKKALNKESLKMYYSLTTVIGIICLIAFIWALSTTIKCFTNSCGLEGMSILLTAPIFLITLPFVISFIKKIKLIKKNS